jgi:REP element-mobilizing transposase RayT
LRQGSSLWERGYFDKAIRDEKHFQIVYDYIKNNAIKAKLHDAKQRFYGIYD